MDEIFREEVRQALAEIRLMRMPFGKYGPDKFPPSGVPIYDLPWDYLHWFHTKQGFPKGRLGELLAIVYQMKSDGSDIVFEAFRKEVGGRHPMKQPKRKSTTFEDGE